jgi:CBS domain containing-hemolysin-like protein
MIFFKGCLKSKTLLENTDKFLNRSVLEYASLQPPLLVSKDTNLFELLMIFQDKKVTLGFVTDEIIKNKKEHVSDDIFFSVCRNWIYLL